MFLIQVMKRGYLEEVSSIKIPVIVQRKGESKVNKGPEMKPQPSGPVPRQEET